MMWAVKKERLEGNLERVRDGGGVAEGGGRGMEEGVAVRAK